MQPVKHPLIHHSTLATHLRDTASHVAEYVGESPEEIVYNHDTHLKWHYDNFGQSIRAICKMPRLRRLSIAFPSYDKIADIPECKNLDELIAWMPDLAEGGIKKVQLTKKDLVAYTSS